MRKMKGVYPGGKDVDLAKAMGIDLLSEEQYRQLQALGAFDTKTSSCIKTSDTVRKLGGAIFGHRRYHTVFIYPNGADAFYSA